MQSYSLKRLISVLVVWCSSSVHFCDGFVEELRYRTDWSWLQSLAAKSTLCKSWSQLDWIVNPDVQFLPRLVDLEAMGTGKEKDERFAAVRKDPRFARFPRKKMTVAIDDRFKGWYRKWTPCRYSRAPGSTNRSFRLQQYSTMKILRFLRQQSRNVALRNLRRTGKEIRRCASFTT